MKRIALVIPALLLGVSAWAGEVGSYPNASALGGTERMLSDQGGITVDITPTQITTYFASHANTFSTLQTFSNNGIAITGSSTGTTTLASANASATNYTLTFPAATDTVVTLASTQTLTNKSISGAQVTSAVATASALAAVPAQCGGSQFATGITANGTANCSTPTSSGNVSNTGTPVSGQLAEWTNATTVQGLNVTGTGNGVLATSPTLVTPNLGTPATLTLTNATGLPISSGLSGLASGMATFMATPTSANLAATVTNETGSGSLVFATSPAFVTPALGTVASANFGSGTFTWPTFNQSTTGNAATATALAALPSQCTGSQFATGIAANGTANCSTPSGSGNVSTSGSPTQYQTPVWASGTTVAGIGPGTSGQLYTSNGASANPSWQSGVSLNGLTAYTAPASTDLLMVYSQANTATDSIALSYFGILSLPSTWTSAQTFTNSDLKLLGSSTGSTTFTSGNASATSYTLTIPAGTGDMLVSSGSITTGHCAQFTGTAGLVADSGAACGGGGSSAFSALTSSTNSTAAMVVGTGASLATSGTGTIVATNTTGVNGAAVPTSAAFVATNSSNQLTSVTASGALNVLNGQTPNAQTGTAYTTVLGDGNLLVTMNNTSSNTVTIPPNSSVAYPIGTVLTFEQINTGATSVALGAGVSIVAPVTLTGWTIGIDFGFVQFQQTATNVWTLINQFPGVQYSVTTVALLPTCGSNLKGRAIAVSDATSPTYNGTLTGGSTTSAIAYCNGTSWLAH